MDEIYGPATAAHYAAYRPPLHEMILARLLPEGAAFSQGLDVGCGTGYSAVALVGWCKAVHGIDPSPHMLQGTRSHEAITFLPGSGENIPLSDQNVDIVTFAGSLYYTDRHATARELARVCRPNAIVLVYDFSVRLEPVLERHGITPQSAEMAYDHRVNFAGTPGFASQPAATEVIHLKVTAAELAHLLLSEPHVYAAYADRFQTGEPFDKLRDMLAAEAGQFTIDADIYYTKYSMHLK